MNIEELQNLDLDALAVEEQTIVATINDLFKRRRLVRTLIRGREQAGKIIAKRDGKAEPQSVLRPVKRKKELRRPEVTNG